MSLNRFLYAGGNPATYTDPSGHVVTTGTYDSSPVTDLSTPITVVTSTATGGGGSSQTTSYVPSPTGTATTVSSPGGGTWTVTTPYVGGASLPGGGIPGASNSEQVVPYTSCVGVALGMPCMVVPLNTNVSSYACDAQCQNDALQALLLAGAAAGLTLSVAACLDEAVSVGGGPACDQLGADLEAMGGGPPRLVSGVQTTLHGAERLAQEFDPEAIAATMEGYVTRQADGATVYVNEAAPGRYDPIVESENGVVTGHRNWPLQAIDRIARNYGWENWPP